MRLALLAFAVLAFAVGCGNGDDEPADPTATATGECASVEAPEPRDPGSSEAPSAPLEDGRTHTLTFDTSCGSFTMTLDTELAPNTAASLVALAEDGYFDDTIFHRVVPDFVIQGGDPTQSGAGGPGYSTVDAPPPDAAYQVGTVAMGKTETEAPGTAGSQFFVVSGTGYGLTPDYAIVGEVTEGMDTVERIDALGVGNGPPSRTVLVEAVTVGKS